MPAFLLPLLMGLKQLSLRQILIGISILGLLALPYGTYRHGRSVERKIAADHIASLNAQALALSVDLQAQRQLTVRTAEERDLARKTETTIRFIPVEKKVIEYVKVPTNISTPCLDDTGSLLANEAIATANAGLAKASTKKR